MHLDLRAHKQALRYDALKKRDLISPDERAAKSLTIWRILAEHAPFKAAREILFYASFRTEVDTHPMIESAIAMGKTVALPKVDFENGRLTKHYIDGLHEVIPGYAGIPEPLSERQVKVEQMDYIIVPGAAFDRSGWRIGYGGGYYDKLLPRITGKVPIVALAFDAQVFGSLPHEEHDVRMDFVITESEIISCVG